MPLAAIWMDLEIIILSVVRQKDRYHMTSLRCGIFQNNTNEFVYKTETNSQSKLNVLLSLSILKNSNESRYNSHPAMECTQPTRDMSG